MSETREAAAHRAIAGMSRTKLAYAVFLAWQYHRQTNVLCAVHELGEEAGECTCAWITETRRLAADLLADLLPD